MNTLQSTTKRLWRADNGQDLIEYALLTGLIALAAVGAVTAVGSAVINSFWAVIAASIPQ